MLIEFDSRTIRTWGRLGSCGSFGLALCEAAEVDESLVALTADLCSYSGLERFKGSFPDRFYNMGIAEQNMVGVAAGMAKEGMNVFATTYGTFAASRCLDQVRVCMGYMGLPVKLVGLTSGLSAGILGATHMSCEDIAIMRSIPHMTIISPADTTETVKAVLAAAAFDGPIYLRLTGVMGSPVVFKSDYPFEIGKAIKLCDGTDILIAATGPTVAECLKCAELLEAKGITSAVFDVHTLKPFDEGVLTDAGRFQLVVAVEEHSVVGGLGSTVASVLSSKGCSVPLLSIGVQDLFPHAAPYQALMEGQGLTGLQISRTIEEALRSS